MPRKPLPTIRPRTPAPAPPRDAAALERFVSASSPAEPGAEAPVRTTTYTRADGEELSRVTVYLPRELHRQLKARCAMLGRPVSEVVTEQVTRWLGK